MARPARILFWTLVAATGAVYGIMVTTTLPEIAAEAGGRAAFDMRPRGYDFTEARAFLTALSDRGRALYLGPQVRLDLAFPALLAATLVWSFARLLGPGRPGWVVAASVPALGAMSFDYLENLRVHGLLSLPPEAVTEAMVRAASFASVGKAALSTLACSTLLALLAWRGWRHLRG